MSAGLLDRFSRDQAAPVVVRWPRPAGEMQAAIRAAVESGWLIVLGGGRRTAYRLRGDARGGVVSLRLSVALLHATDADGYALDGELRDAGDGSGGSELRAALTMPGTASRVWWLVLAAFLVLGALIPIAPLPLWVAPLWIALVVVVWIGPDMRRGRLRRAAMDLEAALAGLDRATPLTLDH